MKNNILKLEDEEENRDPTHDTDCEIMNLRSVQRRMCNDRRQAIRAGSCDRRSGYVDQNIKVAKKLQRPVIDHKEQFARLYGMQDIYYGVRVTRARCQPAIKLLDVIYSFGDAPRLPLPGCTEKCTCQYQGVRNQRCGPRRVGPPDRRKMVREGEPVRRVCQGRRKSDYGFEFFKP